MKPTLLVSFVLLSLSSFIYGAPVQGDIVPCLIRGNGCAIGAPQTVPTATSAAIAEPAVTNPATESGIVSANDTSTVQMVTVTVSACTAGDSIATETSSAKAATETKSNKASKSKAKDKDTASGASKDETIDSPLTVTKTVSVEATATPNSNRKSGNNNDSDKSASISTLESRAGCPPDVNGATLDLLRQGEGLVKSPAPDPSGFETVGFGHKCQKPGCKEVTFPFPMTDATANQLLQLDAKTASTCVNNAVSPNIKLNDNQFGALTSFTFNLGCGALKSSTLLKRLNAGEDLNTVASQEMIKFIRSKGKVLNGLKNRRNAEIALFKTPSGVVAHPC